MVAARRRRASFVHSTRRRDANDNLACSGAEGQRASKNQSDQSLKNHNNALPFLCVKIELPSSSSSKGVIDEQQRYRAENRHEETVEVKPAHAGGSKQVEHPTTGKSADNPQQDVE